MPGYLSEVYVFIGLCVAVYFFLRALPAEITLFIQLPSTILHETAHFIVALLLGGKPSRFSIFPRRTISDSGKIVWQLGSVSFRPTMLSTTPAALAPFVYLYPAWFLFENKYYTLSIIDDSDVIRWVCVLILTAAFLPSTADFRMLSKRADSTLLWSSLVLGGYLAMKYVA